MPSVKRTNLQQIADRVGVTKMTVSRYLKDPELVAAKTAEKIAVAIEELGYVPNRAPDLLSNGRSYAIGVLVPSLSNQVFSDVVRGIESVTEAEGFQCMLAHYGYDRSIEADRIAYLLSYNVDALLLCENGHSEACNRMLQNANVPIIEMMDVHPSSDVAYSIGFDNQAAAADMVNALIHKGYKRIVYLAARMDHRTLLRQTGYEQAMSDHDLASQTVSTLSPSSIATGRSLLKETLQRYPETDAVFCTNDDLAAGAVFECYAQGMNVPSDVAVAGFHGHNFGQQMNPALATVLTPRYEMGKQAAQLALDLLNDTVIEVDRLILPVEITLGETA